MTAVSASFRLTLDRAGSDGFAITSVKVQAHGFYNGQVVSPKPLAEMEQAISGDRAAAPIAIDAPDFAVRGPVAGSKTQTLLMIEVTVLPPASGEICLTPAFLADGEVAPLVLRVCAWPRSRRHGCR